MNHFSQLLRRRPTELAVEDADADAVAASVLQPAPDIAEPETAIEGYALGICTPPLEPGAPALPYSSSDEHLWDELQRVDQLVRAQTLRWRQTIGATKPAELWGMIHVTDAEVEAFLTAPFVPVHQSVITLQACGAGYLVTANRLAARIQQRRAQTPADVPLFLDRLVALLGLDALQRDVLLLCLLPELDGRYRRLFGYLQDDALRTQPSVELILQILQPLIDGPAEGRAAFSDEAPLLRHHLLHLAGNGQGEESLLLRTVRLDERIIAYLLGQDQLDRRLAGMMAIDSQVLGWDKLILDDPLHARLKALTTWWRERSKGGAGATLFLHGPKGSGRQAAARAMTTATATPLLTIDIVTALSTGEPWSRIVDLSYREAYLRQAALFWVGCERLLAPEQPPHQWRYLMQAAEAFNGLTFLASQSSWDPAGSFHDAQFLRLDFPMPSFETRRRLWAHHLEERIDFAEPLPDGALLAELLANGFQLTGGQIANALATARSIAVQRAPHRPLLTLDDLYTGCRRQSGQRLIAMARRIEPRTELTFDNLILPLATRRQVDELRARVRYRHRLYSGLGFEQRLSLGKGLIALFAGSSGTGKTMAAELLAKEQGVDLYKVDLSAVVSKYVGETEKNLSQVFSEAEDSNAIIFFDEADALFGKRGEVKEARDRWANMEINFLLQRIEEYSGVVIMASNLRQNIDEGFLRRIHIIVEFPFPDEVARLHILTGLFPPGVDHPAEDVLRLLATRFRLAGGSLKNIVVDAAFRAMAQAGDARPVISQHHLALATAREYQKLGKPITKGEFGEVYFPWVEANLLNPSAVELELSDYRVQDQDQG